MSESLAELAQFNFLLGPLAIAAVLLLARFRGRGQALAGVFLFTGLALLLAVMSPPAVRAGMDPRQLVAAICVAWLCAFLAPQRSMRPLSTPPEVMKRREEEAGADGSSRVQELIRDHQTQLSLLNERSPGFLWKAFPDGTITYVNSYCWHYLGLTVDEVKADWLQLIHPDDREEVARRWEIVVNGGQWHDHVHRMRRKDGQYLWFQSRITAVRNESGAVVALHGLMIDADETASTERSAWLEETSCGALWMRCRR